MRSVRGMCFDRSMAVFQDQAKDELLGVLEAMANRELFRRWLAVGVRLHDELSDEFKHAFAACIRGFQFENGDVPAPCLDNWEVVGSKLISAGGAARVTACAAIVQSLEALAEARNEQPRVASLTFVRVARLVEAILRDATEYVHANPDVDRFFVELEPEDAAELEQLHQQQPALLIAGLAMSINEWALAFPSVELVQLVYGERSLEVRVERTSN